jgi:hypothetical protein
MADDLRSSGKQVVVSLQLEEPGNLPDHKVACIQSEPGPEVLVVCGAEEGVQVKSAENACVLLSPTDACAQVEPRHCIGHGNEMSGEPSSRTFGSQEGPVGQRALKSAEGRPVNGVDDYRHTRLVGGPASENTGLAAVGVNDVGTILLE